MPPPASPGTSEHDTPAQKKFLITAATVVAASLLLRLYHIGAAEFCVEEAFSVYAAALPTGVSELLRSETSPPLYYLFLRWWAALAGTSEEAVRLPSAFFGTLFVALVIWAGTRWFDRRVGLWSGTFTAVSPLHIYYSQHARTYSLLVLLILLTYLLLWRALERSSWQSWALVSLVATVAIYCHYFAVFGLAASAVLVWSWGRQRPADSRWRAYGIAAASSALMVIPWFVWSILMNSDAGEGGEFMPELWARTPPLAIPKALELFALGAQAGRFPPYFKAFQIVMFPPSLRLLALLVLAVLGLWVTIPWMDKQLGIPELRRRKTWLLIMVVLPSALLGLVSSFVRPIYVVGRYDFTAFPWFVLLFGLAMAKVQAVRKAGPALAVGIVLCLVLPIGVKLVRYYEALALPPVPMARAAATAAKAQPFNWITVAALEFASAPSARATAKTLATEVKDGDVVVFTVLRGGRVHHYLGRLGVKWTDGVCEDRLTGRRFGCRMFPRETEQHPARYDTRRVRNSDEAVLDDVQDFLSALKTSDNVMWLVMSKLEFFGGDPAIVTVLKRLGFQFVSVGAEETGVIIQAKRSE